MAIEFYDAVHKAIVHKPGKWPHEAFHVLDMADMLVGYCLRRSPVREGLSVVAGHKNALGIWYTIPYAGAIVRAYELLAMRKGARGRIRLPPNWRERLAEAGIGWEEMDVAEPLKWARAWEQWRVCGSFNIKRQREWNALGRECAWPCPTITWEARTNSAKHRLATKELAERGALGAQVFGQEKLLSGNKESAAPSALDITRRFRRRISMRESED